MQIVLIGFISLFYPILVYAESTAIDLAATLQTINGVVYVLKPDGKAVLAYEGMTVQSGETINTEKDSSAMLVFTDKGQVALRPETSFQIKDYHYQEDKPAEDNLAIKLLKGGLRSVTGYISKRGNRDAYQLQSATATMGIRGTDYTARLCDNDCDIEQNKSTSSSVSGAIGRIAELTGELTSKHENGESVNLSKSQAFFQNDELIMGDTGYALLVFTDDSRILLQAGSSLKTNNYHYEPAKPETAAMIVNLIKGTARIVTGLIGKTQPNNVKFNTVTATIGIRGTAFDVSCGQGGGGRCDGEIFVSMREGKTIIKSDIEEIDLDNGHTSYVASHQAIPIILEIIPNFIKENANPIPERIIIDVNLVFGKSDTVSAKGLYVSVNDGRVILLQEGKEIEVSKGESGFADLNGSQPLHIFTIPSFIENDNELSKFNFNHGLCGAE